jgi:POT family proton-dependent oligopeptide transporter
MSLYRNTPQDSATMPPGIPYIIGNEAAERFSFYGMRAILVVFMTKYLWLMDRQSGTPMSDAHATEIFHWFVAIVYFTPFFGALLSDILWGKYRTIIILSIVYCLGHATLAFMGFQGKSQYWLYAGLLLICIGSGGIKPCVSAHVGDQFGPRNHHLLTKIYNWFYFSINFGSFFSSLLTPWLLEWYGPHWAFGIPGVLMAIATLMFWMGRKKFIHIPAGGNAFFKELTSRDGLIALCKLIPLFLFVAFFWSLFDQTGSSWVLQAEHMNLHFMNIDWLPSQIQAFNPILILLYIPLFTLVIYPLIHRVFPLTPLRKIGIGFFLTAAAFAISMLIQQWIDAGEKPSIAWQLLAFLVITAAEVMVSIVGLEFAYTQAPQKMKSMVMALYLFAVFVGNMLTAGINDLIQIPSSSQLQFEQLQASPATSLTKDLQQVRLPGHDLTHGTDDDLIAQLQESTIHSIALTPTAAAPFQEAARLVISAAKSAQDTFSSKNLLPSLGNDIWGNPIRFTIISQNSCRLISAGPDGTPNTPWDVGVTIEISKPPTAAAPSWSDHFHPTTSWLERRAAELGATRETPNSISYDMTWFSGGQTKLQGAAYYRFFTWLMLGCAIFYIPFALNFRYKSHFHHQHPQP